MKTAKHNVARALRPLAVTVALAPTVALPTVALAGGMEMGPRGTVPLSRAGAFVAGANDMGAAAYNVAGIYDAAGQFLIDANWVGFGIRYQRKSLLRQVDPNTGKQVATYERTYDAVKGKTPFMPIPTLGAAYRVHRQWVIGGAVWAPQAPLLVYPEVVNGAPAPQRYGMISWEGTAVVNAEFLAAYEPIKDLRIGFGAGLFTGVTRNVVALSACVPERFMCAAEDPHWDTLGEVKGGPIFAPTGQIGVQYKFKQPWKIGAAFHLPSWVRTPAHLRARLPTSALFEEAKTVGNHGRMVFEYPWSLRAGVETSAVKNLKLEVAVAYTHWAMHDTITVESKDIAIQNAALLPQNFYLSDVVLPRHFRGSVSAALGGEYMVHLPKLAMAGRAGFAFENSAIPAEYLNAATIDSNKYTLGFGGSIFVGRVRLDATYAHIFLDTVNVDPKEARQQAVSPMAANPAKSPVYNNGGSYKSHANLIGLGLTYQFQKPEESVYTEEYAALHPEAAAAEANRKAEREAIKAGRKGTIDRKPKAAAEAGPRSGVVEEEIDETPEEESSEEAQPLDDDALPEMDESLLEEESAEPTAPPTAEPQAPAPVSAQVSKTPNRAAAGSLKANTASAVPVVPAGPAKPAKKAPAMDAEGTADAN